MRRRPILGVGVVTAAIALALVLARIAPTVSPPPLGSAGPSRAGGDATATAHPTVIPLPGHEVFGFLPYWEMTSGIAVEVGRLDLTTLALFSVTHARDGAIDTTQTGYQRITGDIGKGLIRDAHRRGIAVQLVYTSLSAAKNTRLFASTTLQDATIAALVAFVHTIGVDGIDVDVEQLDPSLIPAYGAFVGRLRDTLRTHEPKAEISVATGAGRTGAAMAAAAATAGADRIVIQGYDYHYASSDVGASAPMARRDGAEETLPWSLDLYASLGVPVQRTILALPLYGMRWRVAGPEIGSPPLGNGAIWVPADNPKFLASPPIPPFFDPLELVEFYAVGPTVSPLPGDSRATAGWQAIYVDAPQTLTPKLTLADDHGLAGAGFWAIGYTSGLSGYADLIARFAAGKLD